jgi:hypothetical protein
MKRRKRVARKAAKPSSRSRRRTPVARPQTFEEARAANLADPFHAARIARLDSGERFPLPRRTEERGVLIFRSSLNMEAHPPMFRSSAATPVAPARFRCAGTHLARYGTVCGPEPDISRGLRSAMRRHKQCSKLQFIQSPHQQARSASREPAGRAPWPLSD